MTLDQVLFDQGAASEMNELDPTLFTTVTPATMWPSAAPKADVLLVCDAHQISKTQYEKSNVKHLANDFFLFYHDCMLKG